MNISQLYSSQDLHFIRCILPNNEKRRGEFEEKLVLKQLFTSSIIAYANFMRFGYPNHVAVNKIIGQCRSLENKLSKAYNDRLDFCSKVLSFIGFKPEDYKKGTDEIFFRSNKFHLLEQFFSDTSAVRNENETSSAREERRRPK